MNDYEAHLSSYDHSHKQRLKDMKAMVRDPNAGARARKAEAKAEGIVSIKLPGQEAAAPGGSGTGGFKKGGFKKSGFKSAFAPADVERTVQPAPSAVVAPPKPVMKDSLVESDTEDEGYDVYDPRHPTD
jgi:hypothetical protein